MKRRKFYEVARGVEGVKYCTSGTLEYKTEMERKLRETMRNRELKTQQQLVIFSYSIVLWNKN